LLRSLHFEILYFLNVFYYKKWRHIIHHFVSLLLCLR